MMAEGPFDELLSGIQDVIDDLNRKLTAAEDEYQHRSVEHDSETKRIQGEIDSANSDIANTQEFLNNVLYIQKDNLESDIAHLQQYIVDTQNYIESETNSRTLEHSEFEEKTVEHADAIAALEEALGLLLSLQGGDASLAQVKKTKNSL